MKKLGVEITDDKSAFDVFKEALISGISEITGSLKLDEKFKEITSTIGDTKETAIGFFEDMSSGLRDSISEGLGLNQSFESWEDLIGAVKEKFDELGLDDFITTIKEISNLIDEDLINSFKAASDALVTIANAITDVRKALGKLRDSKLGKFIIERQKEGTKGIIESNIFNPFKGTLNDFIMRPGMSPQRINPQDTVVGFKGGAPGGVGGSTVINNIFNGFTMDDLRRELDSRDRRLVDDLRRLSRT